MQPSVFCIKTLIVSEKAASAAVVLSALPLCCYVDPANPEDILFYPSAGLSCEKNTKMGWGVMGQAG